MNIVQLSDHRKKVKDGGLTRGQLLVNESEQQAALEKLGELQGRLMHLSRRALKAVEQGVSTGNPLKDFIIAASAGVLDPSVVARYNSTQNALIAREGYEVIIAQKGVLRVGDRLITLQNICLAYACPDPILYDNEKLCMTIPVMPGVAVFRTFSDASGHESQTKVFLDKNAGVIVGPLEAQYNAHLQFATEPTKNAPGHMPMSARCQIIVSPWDDDDLEVHYKISRYLIDELRRSFRSRR